VITFAATLAADTVPAAALNAETAGAVAADGAGEFGNVLRQLMGASPNAGVDLPLDYEGDDAPDEADLDELVNATVIELGVQPAMRLMPAWMVAEVPAAPAPVAVAPATEVAERSVSASAMLGTSVAGVEAPAVPGNASTAFDALMAEATVTPAESSLADAPAAAASSGSPSVETTSASAPATPPVNALPQGTENPPVAPATAQGQGTSAVPTPEPAPRDTALASAAVHRGAEKHDPTRQASRITAEAGQRAYAAAASEGAKKDTQNGFGQGRHDDRGTVEASSATPSTPAAAPFQVVADRPAPPVAATVGAAVVVAPEAVEAAAAIALPAQVVQSIRMQATHGGGEAIVRLNPEYLGELVVAVKVENGAVSAALQSDTPAVRKWVESNEATLRQALAEHGLQLDRLTVSDEPPATESGERGHQDQQEHEDESQPQSRRQRKKAPDATFEVVV
jgi:flagellar hook-length control protein FliK